jgi:hypothetical protein
MGLVIHPWKGLENAFPSVYYTSLNFQNLKPKKKKKNF